MQFWGFSNLRGWMVFDDSETANTCPRCRGRARRVPRRPIDRLISLISPRHRYHCQSRFCCWEGTLPDGRK